MRSDWFAIGDAGGVPNLLFALSGVSHQYAPFISAFFPGRFSATQLYCASPDKSCVQIPAKIWVSGHHVGTLVRTMDSGDRKVRLIVEALRSRELDTLRCNLNLRMTASVAQRQLDEVALRRCWHVPPHDVLQPVHLDGAYEQHGSAGFSARLEQVARLGGAGLVRFRPSLSTLYHRN